MDRAPQRGATQVAEAGSAPPLYPTPVGGAPRILILFSDTGGGHRAAARELTDALELLDRKSTRLNSSHGYISYAVFCLQKKQQFVVIEEVSVKSSQYDSCNTALKSLVVISFMNIILEVLIFH